MVAPLPQERAFKREFDQNRLAAIRGDDFALAGNEYLDEGAANNGFFLGDTPHAPANDNRFFAADSEDGLLANISRPLSSIPAVSEENTIPDPADFTFMQQQARMAEGIGAPELIPPEAAALPDPEYSTEDDIVTYGESVAALNQQARMAETSDVVQNLKSRMREKAQQAVNAAGDALKKMIKEQTNRWIAKGVGNGGNALDSVGWDGWTAYAATYLYIMARGFVSVISPESSLPSNIGDFTQGVQYTATKGIHILFPPYRPLREPGDFLWFLATLFISFIILTLVIFALLLLMTLTSMPAFLPGAGTSSL